MIVRIVGPSQVSFFNLINYEYCTLPLINNHVSTKNPNLPLVGYLYQFASGIENS